MNSRMGGEQERPQDKRMSNEMNTRTIGWCVIATYSRIGLPRQADM